MMTMTQRGIDDVLAILNAIKDPAELKATVDDLAAKLGAIAEAGAELAAREKALVEREKTVAAAQEDHGAAVRQHEASARVLADDRQAFEVKKAAIAQLHKQLAG